MTSRFAAVTLAVVALQLHGQVINTFAGGRSDNGLLATDIGLGRPGDVAFDAAGNMYISDVDGQFVRRIDAATDRSTVVAGNGFAGSGGDGGPATEAQLNQPTGLALDSHGNLYISDTGNQRVRRVDAVTHVITRFTGAGTSAVGDGGPASAASVLFPHGLSFDRSDNLFIADTGHNRIRRVDAVTHVITTISGNDFLGFSGDGGPASAALLGNPEGVSVDGGGNLYIADTNNDVIRRIDASTGIINTIAGNHRQGFSGDSGPATSAMLWNPSGVTLDAEGSLWIADTGNNRIRKVDATATIRTVAEGDFNSPQHVAFDRSGNAYVADYGNHRVRKIDAVTNSVTTVAGGDFGDGLPATQAQLLGPISVAIADSGNVYIAEYWNGRVRKVDAQSGKISTVVGGDASFPLTGPSSVAVDSAENLYLLDAGRIIKVDAASGKPPLIGGANPGFSGDGGPATAARFYPAPWSALTTDKSRNIYIADTYNNRVRRIDHATGIVTTIAGKNNGLDVFGDGGPATNATVPLPVNVAVDKDGNLFIAQSNLNLRRVDAKTAIITTFGPDNGGHFVANAPFGLAVDPNGNLLITAWSPLNRVMKLDAKTLEMTTLAGTGVSGFSGDGGPATSALLRNPYGVAVANDGTIYIADTYNNRVRIIRNLRRRSAGRQ